MRECDCGSGQESWWRNDAQGVPLCRVCDECEKAKLSRYRPEILTGHTQEDIDEPIEREDVAVIEGADYYVDFVDSLTIRLTRSDKPIDPE